jgi:hypothetical protein
VRRQPERAPEGRLGIPEVTDGVEVPRLAEELLDLRVPNLDGVP